MTNRSPIENMLRAAICARAEVEMVDLYDYSDCAQSPAPMRNGRISFVQMDASIDGDPEHHGHSPKGQYHYWRLLAGIRVGGYVVDFVLANGDGGVAIECDGHDFHDRTKQQAAYDRARDRALLIVGLATIRFTGSEIHHDSDRCAADAFACARSEASRNEALLLGYESGWSAGHDAGVREGARQCYVLAAVPEEIW